MRKTIVFVILFLGLITIGCQPDIVRRKNIICMIDYSGTIKPEIMNIYAETIANKVFKNLTENDKWILIPIDEGSKIQPVHLLEDDLSKEGIAKGISSVTKRKQIIKQRLDEYLTPKRDNVFNTVIAQKDVRKKYTNYSDILGALDQVKEGLEQPATRTSIDRFWDSLTGTPEIQSENIIIIFSDMIHESSELNFQTAKLDDKAIDKVIVDLKAKNKIPDLKGVTVLVCGRTGKNNAMIDGIQAFWKKYFEEAYANLRIYDYDASNAIAVYLKSD